MITTAYRKLSYKQGKNAVRGRRNRAEGASFEAEIVRSCKMYENTMIAFIEKTPEPMKIIGKLGDNVFKTVFEKSAQPDFKGTIAPLGKAICFDAKCTSTDKIPISALTTEQIYCLNLHRELGAWAGVLMCFKQGNTPTYAMIPINIFLGAKLLNNHKHWTVEDCQQWIVPAKATMNGYIIDFLQGIVNG